MKEDKKNKSQNQNSELNKNDLESVAGGDGWKIKTADGKEVDFKDISWTNPPMWEVDLESIKRKINSESNGK